MEERRNLPQNENSPLKWRYNLTRDFFTFWKTVKMYGGENERIDEVVINIFKSLNFFFKTKSEVIFYFDGIDIKINGKRIRGRRQEDKYFEDLYDLFLSLCLAEVKFEKGVEDKEILSFFRAIGKYPVGREPKVATFERIEKELPELKNLKITPYDPEEAGNLPIFSKEQKIFEIYRALISQFNEFSEAIVANETLSLVVLKKSIQDLISILKNNKNSKTWDLAVFLTMLNSYDNSFKGARIVSRVFFSVLTAIILKLSNFETLNVGISAFFQTMLPSDALSFKLLSKMSDFSFCRINAAVLVSAQMTSFNEEMLNSKQKLKHSSIYEEILNVVSYFDENTQIWPEKYKKSNAISRVQALRNLIKFSLKGIFMKEITEAFILALGVIPAGTIQFIRGTKTFAIPAKSFHSFSEKKDVFVLDYDLKLIALKEIRADMLADIPHSGDFLLPSSAILMMLRAFFK